MKDRLLFNEITLTNGMKVYAQPDTSVPFVDMSLTVPLGHAHNHGAIVPGTFHYLEHIIMKRSERYPELGSLKGKASHLGGQFGASTWLGKTSYDLSATKDNFEELFKGVCSHFFTPVFNSDDIALEAGIIINERKRRATFYPGTNFMTQHMGTVWANTENCSLEQKFGSDADMVLMNKAYFEQVHQMYKTKNSYLIIAGNFDLDFVCKHLESYELLDVPLPEKQFIKNAWRQRYFHEVPTVETSRFNYHIASLFPVSGDDTQKTLRMMSIMHAMLLDYSYGVLMGWLRHKNKWCYELKAEREIFEEVGVFELIIPLNSREQVVEVRKQLLAHVLQIFDKPEFLEMVKQHKRNMSMFWYQTIGDRMNSARNDLHLYGSIETEAQYYETLQSVTTADIEQFFREKIMPNLGEVLFVPQ